MKTAIIAITANGARIGADLHAVLPDSALFVIDKHAAAEAQAFSGRLQTLADRLWPQFQGFVFIMATGIVARTIAPLLRAKDMDPAVVVLDDAGKFAISLLSGHLGGANALAARCAEIVGSIPVITTATDVNELPSFDMLAKENGWVIDDLSRMKMFNALLLEGKEIAVIDHRHAVRKYFDGKGHLSFHDDLDQAMQSGAAGCVLVTNRIIPHHHGSGTLILRPVNLFLGIGCNRGTSCEEINSVVKAHLERLSVSIKSVRCIATAEAKRDETGLLAFAKEKGLQIHFYGSNELNEVAFPSPPSDHAFAAIGAKGVAEPAALLASGGGRLLMRKVKEGNVTLAIAESS